MSTQGTILSIRNQRGTQREYETVLILRPEIGKQSIVELVERIRSILEREGGSLIRVDNWGLRTLAYAIRRNKRGVYLYTRYLGGSGMVTELERNLRINDQVLRFLTVLIDEDVDPQARPTEVTAEAMDAVGEVAPDPLDRMPEDDGDDDRRDRDDDDDDDDDDQD